MHFLSPLVAQLVCFFRGAVVLETKDCALHCQLERTTLEAQLAFRGNHVVEAEKRWFRAKL